MHSRLSRARSAAASLAAAVMSLFVAVAPACQVEGFDPHRYDPGAWGADTGAAGDSACQLGGATLSVATFNLHRFFDMVCDSGRCESGFETRLTPAEFQAKALTLARGVRELDADVVLLQEVESHVSLDALVGALEGDYRVAVLGLTPHPASTLDVAVIARVGGLRDVVTHRDRAIVRDDGRTTSFARELLEVHIDTDAGHAIVFSAHFKSQRNDDPGRRLAEARAARDIVVAAAIANPEALVVFGGDLNDIPGSPPLEALEADGALVRVGTTLTEGEDWTYQLAGRRLALDHLYYATAAAARPVPGSVAVYRDADGGFAGSDHAAVRAEFASSPQRGCR